ncbi:unnamed protein product [Lupinus luteus]|uniref:Protein kinase domain-containing protein n=1 Tax=Lupinus luteus TaxID=3873 RepID=A0AAV1XQ27_LUPLU
MRVGIALGVARGLEYLYDGAVPPVIHRDIKSSNILLDRSMRAMGTEVDDTSFHCGQWVQSMVDSKDVVSLSATNMSKITALMLLTVKGKPRC